MSVNKRNSEGYFDPTEYKALTKIEQEAKAHAYRPSQCKVMERDALKKFIGRFGSGNVQSLRNGPVC